MLLGPLMSRPKALLLVCPCSARESKKYGYGESHPFKLGPVPRMPVTTWALSIAMPKICCVTLAAERARNG